jgi:hypothetical protein
VSPRPVAATSWAWLTDYPSTSGRILMSTVLAAVYVLAVTTCLAFNRPLNAEVVEKIQWFLVGMMTADVAQFITKRKTWQADTANTPPAPGTTPPANAVTPLNADGTP